MMLDLRCSKCLIEWEVIPDPNAFEESVICEHTVKIFNEVWENEYAS